MTWPGVLSQRTYPGAGDVDDCWCVATIWAAVASRPDIWRPSVTTYRRHAGDPDDGIRDGGSLDEVIRGARGCWPDLPVLRVDSTSWPDFAGPVKAGRPSSLAVDSATLPSGLRFGFLGKHQIGVAWDAGARTFVVANPLAPDGSRPIPISETALHRAAIALIPQARVIRAAVFPAPLPDTSTGDDMEIHTESWMPGAVTIPKGTPYTNAAGTPIGTIPSGERPYLAVVCSPDGKRTAIRGDDANDAADGRSVLGWVVTAKLRRR